MAIVETVLDVIVGAQTEILIFVVAVCVHAVLFGKYRVSDKRSSPKRVQATSKEGGDRHASSPRNAANASTNAFARAVQDAIAENAGEEALREEVVSHLSKYAPAARAEVIANMLSNVGKTATKELISACRDVVDKQALPTNSRLDELCLRGYLVLRLRDEFEELFAEVETHRRVVPSIAALALRAAIASGDLEAAIARLATAAPAWLAGAAATPSTAHGQLLRQLARLAVDQGALPRLVAALESHDLLVGWTIEALLAECAQHDDPSLLQDVRRLADKRGVALTAASHAALVRGAATPAGALAALEDAVAGGKMGKEGWLAAVAAAVKHEDRELAEALISKLPAQLAPEVLAAVLRLCEPCGPLAGKDQEETVLRLYARFSPADLSADHEAEWLVASAAARLGKTQVLEQVVAAASDNPRQVALLKRFATDKRLDDSHKVFEACAEKTSCLFNAMLDACIDCSDIRSTERIMTQATDAGAADIVTYNTMIKAHIRRGDARKASILLDKMRSLNIQPNCVTFNELIDACIRDRPERVWGLLDEMRASGVKPNHVTCSIILKSVNRYSKAIDVEKALAVVDRMDDVMDEVLLSSLCEACIRASRGDLLHRQLQRQRQTKSVQIKGAHTFGSIIRAYGYLQDVDGVWDTWREMKKRHIVPTSVTLGCMVEALAANGGPDAAYELISEQMEDPQTRPLVNAVIYCSVLKGFSHSKRFNRVWAIHQEMKAAKLQFSIVTYNTLVDACARSGEMGRIPNLLEEMSAQDIQPNVITYSAIIKGYCQENRLDRAFELLEEMKKTKFTPDEVTYNTLIDGCARYGMWDRGIKVLEEMKQMGVAPSNFTLSVLVKLANRSKRPDKAFEITEEVSAQYRLRLGLHVFNNLIHACTAHGDLSRGLDVLERMLREKVQPDSRTYMLLLRGAVAQKSSSDAAGLLRAAAGLPGAHSKAARFGALAKPKGGLQSDTISEAIEGMASACEDEALALQLLCDLRKARGVSVDPRLQLRLTSKAVKQPASCRA